MLNKELLMIQAELPPVHVALQFFGGRNSGTDYTWTSPDGTVKQSGVFDERIFLTEKLTCKPNTEVLIATQDYSGDYRVTPPQDISIVEESNVHHIKFTAFRDVDVIF